MTILQVPPRFCWQLAFLLTIGGFLRTNAHGEDLSNELPRLIERTEPAVVRIEVELPTGSAIGSGFLVDKWVVTNYHVIDGAKEAAIIFSDKTRIEVSKVYAYDEGIDIALLDVGDISSHTRLMLAKSLPKKGALVVAFGAPQGFSFTTSDGIVSAIRSGEEISTFLKDYDYSGEATWVQTTTPISGGNSGGPLVDRTGDVVGVNSWTYRDGQNLNFAISSVDVLKLMSRSDGSTSVAIASLAQRKESKGSRGKSIEDRLFAAYFTPAFEKELSKVRSNVENAARKLAESYRSTRVTQSTISTQKADYESAMQFLIQLRDYEPKISQFLKGEGAILGHPGEWYVFQVTGSKSMLVKPSRRSSELFQLEGVSSAGIVDEMTHRFSGVWFSIGETYTYSTLAGSTKTVYKLRALNSSAKDLSERFRKSVVIPQVDDVIADIKQPSSPAGAELVRIESERAAWQKKQDRLAREAKIAADERVASGKFARATRFMNNNPSLAKKWLNEIAAEYGHTPSGQKANRLLGRSSDEREYRVWKSGKFSTEARLVSVEGERITLEKRDGKRVTVPLSRLSARDRAYARSQSNRP